MRLLHVAGLCLGYGDMPVVNDLELVVEAGQVVSLLGPNGAGKTTSIRGMIGELRPTTGTVDVLGMRGAPLHLLARNGLAYVAEERSVFAGLSVEQSLRVAGCAREEVYAYFPELERLNDRRVGLLSGGEQQMLVVGCLLARHPRLMIVDELSLGLAPKVVGRLLLAIREAADRGVGVLLVEQHVTRALEISDRAIVLTRGRIALQGSASEVRGRLGEVRALYVSATSLGT